MSVSARPFIQPITVALRLDNRATEITGPKPLPVLDFHLYHGLYRTVWLVIKPTLHITDEILESKPASSSTATSSSCAERWHAASARVARLGTPRGG